MYIWDENIFILKENRNKYVTYKITDLMQF